MFQYQRMVEAVLEECDSERFVSQLLPTALRLIAHDYDQLSEFSDIGGRLVRTDLARTVRQRAAFEAYDAPVLHSSPEFVFIVGLPRTGSTMVHNLMALDPATSTVSLSQAMWPFRLSDRDRGITDAQLLTELQVNLFDRLSPGFRDVHPMSPAWPEECITLLQLAGVGPRLLSPAPAPSYAEWVDRVPPLVPYQELRRMLAIIRPRARRWVLKTAAHLRYLDTLEKVFRPAAFVWLHRDPERAVASYCRLVYAIRSGFSGSVEPTTIGPEWLPRCASAMDAALDVVGSLSTPIVHSRFESTSQSPLETVARIYDRLGWSVPPEFSRMAQAWMEETASASRQPLASLETFGLTTSDVRRRFARYFDFVAGL